MKRCPICARSYPVEELFCSVHGLPLVEEREGSQAVAGEHSGAVLEERYRLGGVLGAGGMGVVYEAEHLRIGRTCAVKVLLPAGANDPKLKMRFFQEVRATSRIRHPNVVEILDFGEHPRVGSYMVMERLEGAPLSRVLEDEAPLPLPTVCAIGVQLCAALGATHSQGLLHRDLKPSNVFRLPGGAVKVLDFGLVKPVEGDGSSGMPSLTTDGMILGTPWYMSPEQFRGEAVDGRADVYALGVMLYEMLVGRPPFDGASPMELMSQHLHEPVPPPREVRPELALPASAEMMLYKVLSKSRATRYQSMAELADVLYGLAEEQGFELLDRGARPAPRAVGSSRGLAGTCADDAATDRWVSAAPFELATAEPLDHIRDLHALFASRRGEVVERVIAALLRAFPRYRSLDPVTLRARIDRAVLGAIDVIGRDSAELEGGDYSVARIADPDEQISLTELVTALWLAYTTARPMLLEAAAGDLERFATLAEQLDSRVLPYFFHAADSYVTLFLGRLQRANDALAKRNEELQELRQTMAMRVAEASRQLAEAERLKARVMEAVSSGMVLVERDTRRILVWNPAMERLSGLPASAVVGRPVAEFAHLFEGVPIEELAEQIRDRQEVGLRKLRVRFGEREQRSLYLSGQPFFDASGERAGTLFIFDDVTEREQVIESLGRFLSRDLVDRILSRPGLLEPGGEQRRAVILSAEVRSLDATLERLSPEGVARLLSAFVRAVTRAVFPRGGTVERIAPDGLIAYFARLGESTAPALEAAVELAQRLSRLGEGLAAEAGGGLELACGVHVGDIMVVNAGGERFMVRTVVGEAMRTAEALREAAAPGEILVSPEAAATAGTTPLELGPEVALAGRPNPIRTSRVLFASAPDLDEDPDTLVR